MQSKEELSFPAPRKAILDRQTSETRIQIDLNLDGSGVHHIATGIGFLDHLIAHIAVHGGIDLTLQADGDLHIDPHHTIEDTALALGQALNQALGDRRGLVRMASCFAPMDETLAFVAIDLSGRPYCVFTSAWQMPLIGQFPTSMIQHFFESISVTTRMNLHARIEYGRDDHHKAEALFKAFGRAFSAASGYDNRHPMTIPSTKGTLTA